MKVVGAAANAAPAAIEPETGMVCGVTAALSAMTMLAVRVPVAFDAGLKVTMKSQDVVGTTGAVRQG